MKPTISSCVRLCLLGAMPAILGSGLAWAQPLAPYGYIAARAQNTVQDVSGQQRYSPRAIDITRGPESPDKFGGALALGLQLPGHWRAEAEYVMPMSTAFDTQWRFRNPTTGVVGNSRNVVQLRAQRLMFNAYRDVMLSEDFSVYGGLGIGLAHVSAQGYQGVVTRRFEMAGKTNLAWSATLGMSWRMVRDYTLGVGYRYVDLGRYRTGTNVFLNNASGQRDEQHGGRWREQNLFVELRKDL